MEEEKQGVPNPPPMGMLNALLSNPELLQRMGGLLGAMSQSGASSGAQMHDRGDVTPASEGAAEPSEAASASAGGSALGEGLGAVLSNPAVMAKLPEIMAMMKSLSAPAPSHGEGGGGGGSNRNLERLLLALKPFLSPARCDAVNSILRISKLGAAFQLLK